MFGLTLRIDCAARSKKGHAAQMQTGVASASSASLRHAAGSSSAIAMTSRGADQSRRDPEPASHVGQLPGPPRTICGCMAHVQLPGAGRASARDRAPRRSPGTRVGPEAMRSGSVAASSRDSTRSFALDALDVASR